MRKRLMANKHVFRTARVTENPAGHERAQVCHVTVD